MGHFLAPIMRQGITSMHSQTSSFSVQPLKTRHRKKKTLFPFLPEQVWVDRNIVSHPQTIRILNQLQDAEIDIVDNIRSLKTPASLNIAKKQLVLTEHKGHAFKECQGITPNHLCCNYRTLDLVSGCPMDCSYCILQSYLANNPITTVYVNLEQILDQVASFLKSNKGTHFRIGTGELGDSLALDPIIDYASILIPFFAQQDNAVLELKTKTNFVDHILKLRHRNRTIIAWSINTPDYIQTEESHTASLEKRIEAAQKVIQAGYRVAFHFDPIFILKDIDTEMAAYQDVIATIFEHIDPQYIAWISLGLLRYPKNLPQIAEKRFPNTRIYTGELVPSDSKVRYLRFIREHAYKLLWNTFQKYITTNKLYLCMETHTVWQKVDTSINSNECIDKRLCTQENVLFDFKNF